MRVIEELLKEDKVDLSPGEFLAVWRHEQKLNGAEGRRKNMVEGDELFEVFVYYEKARKSPNQLVKHIRMEGTACSNERARTLFPLFTERFAEESNEQS